MLSVHARALSRPREIDITLDEALCYACMNSDTQGIRDLLEKGARFWPAAIFWAIMGGLPCVQVMHESGEPWAPDVMTVAAIAGRREVMQYIHAHPPFQWTMDTSYQAARGHLSCLQFAHENGAPWSPDTTLNACRGNLQCLVYAVEHGCPWHPNAMSVAALDGDFECLEYGWSKGATFDERTTNAAARGGGCLQFLLERGCMFSASDRYVRRNVALVVAALTRRNAARLIQRSWRSRKQAVARKAVSVIEDAYMAWACRPSHGSWYRRSCTSFSLN